MLYIGIGQVLQLRVMADGIIIVILYVGKIYRAAWQHRVSEAEKTCKKDGVN